MHAEDEHENGQDGDGAEGAAVFPLISEEVEVHPLLLALLHAIVFIDGSTDEIVCPDAAVEAMQYLITYLQRLHGNELTRLQADMKRLLTFAKQEGWSKQQQAFLKSFLAEHGIGE